MSKIDRNEIGLAEGRWLWRRLYVFVASAALWLLLARAVGRTAPPSIENTIWIAYSGLVPMSPKTTPRAATVSPVAAVPARRPTVRDEPVWATVVIARS